MRARHTQAVRLIGFARDAGEGLFLALVTTSHPVTPYSRMRGCGNLIAGSGWSLYGPPCHRCDSL